MGKIAMKDANDSESSTSLCHQSVLVLSLSLPRNQMQIPGMEMNEVERR